MRIHVAPRALLAVAVVSSLLVLLFPSTAIGQTSSLSISDTTIVEGDSGNVVAQLTVTRSGATNQSATVDFITSDETATFDGADFYQTWGTVAFAAGVTSQTIQINVVGDTVDEADETFLVTLSNATGASISDAVGRVTIIDDDGPVTVSIGDATVTEGDTGSAPAMFTVTLSRPVSASVSISYSTVQGTATTDFAQSSGTLVFGPGQTSRTISIPVAGDVVDESDETFFVDLSDPVGVVIADGRGTGTIVDNDTAGSGGGGGGGGGGTFPSASVSDASVTEGDGGTTSMFFTVTLSSSAANPVEVDYQTISRSARSPQDFTPSTGTLTFAPGETVKQFSVPIVGDQIDESDETFEVFLSRVSGATFGDSDGIGTIHDDDGLPALSVADVEVVEGDSGTTTVDLVLQLSSPSSGFVSVDVETADGTAEFSDGDYHSASGGIVFNPGVTTRTVSLSVVGDTKIEPDEYFTVVLSNLQGATTSDLSALVHIRTDDPGTVASITTLTVRKRQGLLVARGQVIPQVSGSVTVRLMKKRDGVFRRIRQEPAVLVERTNGAGEEISSYRTTFPRPQSGRCRIVVIFAGNEQVEPSRTRSTFRC